MFCNVILTFAAAISVAIAQTEPGFPVPAAQSLTVRFGNNIVAPAGELIPRPETASAPNISTTVWVASSDNVTLTPQPGILLLVDLDVPRNNTRVQHLHWLATNVTLGPAVSSSNSTPLVVPNAPVPYLQPSPPVGDAPHSYNFVVFLQPANFSVPAQYRNLTSNRAFFNVSQFVRDAGLGQPLAGSFFQVQNLSGTPTTTYPPARSPTSAIRGNESSPVPFSGAAAQSTGARSLWVGVATALVTAFASLAL